MVKKPVTVNPKCGNRHDNRLQQQAEQEERVGVDGTNTK